MRALFAIPHYHDPTPGGLYGSVRDNRAARVRALRDAIAALHQLFGPPCWTSTSKRLGWSSASSRSDFFDRDTSFIGALESAAMLGVMRTFSALEVGGHEA